MMSSDKLKKSTLINREDTWNKDWWIGTPEPEKKDAITFLLDADNKNFNYPFGTEENTPWLWDEKLKRPVLYWETDMFIPKNSIEEENTSSS